MENKQKEFIWLVYGEKRKYADVSLLLGVPRKQLTIWSKELENEWRPISQAMKIYNQKKITVSPKEFYDHFRKMELNRCCEYCGVTEKELEELEKLKPLTKRKRGKLLELDRKEPNTDYNNLKNLVFACYWCNNAKTDTFSHEEFLKVGKTISSIWKERLGNVKR